MKLSPDQEKAKETFLDFIMDSTSTETAIAGPAGTGKTFLVKELITAARKNLKMLEIITNDKNQLSVHLTSTTNKAARVLRDMSGEQSKTIHSLLGLKVKNDYKTGKVTLKKSPDTSVITNHLIFVDEASMVNKDLLKNIRDNTHKCKVVYIGDEYQLPPVFENTSCVFTDVKKQIRLTTIQRQLKNSPIISTASGFREAVDTQQFPQLYDVDDTILNVSAAEFQDRITHAYQHEPEPDKYKIVAWTNGRVHQYNDYVRSIQGRPKTFEEGEILVANEPVMERGSNKIIYTTDSMAKVTRISEVTEKGVDCWLLELDHAVLAYVPKNVNDSKTILKHYAKHQDWKNYFAFKDTFSDLRPVHASTVHKAQGSTYHTTFIDLPDIGSNRKWYEVARMMYVAITRSSDKVIMRGVLPKKYS